MKHITDTVMMIRPGAFGYNEQTAINNAFQHEPPRGEAEHIRSVALDEFDGLVNALRQHGIDVIVIDDLTDRRMPDAVFPNNWISFHQSGIVVLYPMFAENRRWERRLDLLDDLLERKFLMRMIVDLSPNERFGKILEGTGSMVFDRKNRLVYACLSPRTDLVMLESFCQQFNFSPVTFRAMDRDGVDIYHTNVLMALGESFCCISLECIPDPDEKQHIIDVLHKTEREIIDLSHEQILHFAGNMLELSNHKGEHFLVMSSQARNSLTDSQVERLNRYVKIIHSPLDTIETYGGGSARCMLAEVFLHRELSPV